ncbi:hypothetical protein TNCV_5126371 [Trichonephila clavipes]|nr:hypothetical protein TNCV_5126371 [Trichonephila clavipes]
MLADRWYALDKHQGIVRSAGSVFSSGETVAVGIILRLCTKVSDLAVEEYWCMVASPLTGAPDLYIIRDGPLTAHRFRDEILIPIVVPYAAAIGR